MRDEASLKHAVDIHNAIHADIRQTSNTPQATSDTLKPSSPVISDLQISQTTGPGLPLPDKSTQRCKKCPIFPTVDRSFEMYSDYPVDDYVRSPPTTGQITCSFPDPYNRSNMNARSDATKRALSGTAGEDKSANKETNLGCTPVNRFNQLPLEIRIRIFKMLTMKELVLVSRVCRNWLHLAYDGSLWSRLDIRQGSRSISNELIVRLFSAAGHFLRIVNFRGCVQMSSTALRRLGENCPNIRAAQLTGCRSISSRSLIRFVSRCRYLQSLDVSGLSSVNGALLNALAESNRGHLEDLQISKCRNLKGNDLHRVLETRQNLLSLKIGFCRSLDGTIFSLINRQVQLRHLSLAHCGFVRAEHVKELFSPETNPPPNLISLDIAGNPFVSDEAIQNMAVRCTRLRHLDVEECSQITDASLFCLAKHTPKLQILSMAQCDLITDTGIARLVRKCCELQRLELDCCGAITDAALLDITTLLQARSVAQTPLDSIPAVTSTSALFFSKTPFNVPETPNLLSEIDLFDCRNVTRQGIRDVGTKVHGLKVKCFYTWQDREEEQSRSRQTEVELLNDSTERDRPRRRNYEHTQWRRTAACTIL